MAKWLSLWSLSFALLLFVGCKDDSSVTSELNPDGGASGSDGSVANPGSPDGGTVGGDVDGSVADDGGTVEPPDAAVAGPDATLVIPPGFTKWGPSQGLPQPIYDVSTDEGGNVWAIGADTLYLLTPGAASFVGFGVADGIHIEPFTSFAGTPTVTRLTAVAGATPNRVYLGYQGYDDSPDPNADPVELARLGNGDRIDYDPATGHIAVNRYEFRCSLERNCWEDRTVNRIVFGHTGAAAGHAFFAMQHGAVQVFNDVIGDHVHPEIDWVAADGTAETHYGGTQALALKDDGTIWIGNRYGFALKNWDPDPLAWVNPTIRSGKFSVAYTQYTTDHAIRVPTGYSENNRGSAMTADGTLWLASDVGLSSWNPSTPISTIRQWDPSTGIPAGGYNDVVADTDGTLWLITAARNLLHFDPATSTVTPIDILDARRLYLDKSITPRALFIARASGVSVIR